MLSTRVPVVGASAAFGKENHRRAVDCMEKPPPDPVGWAMWESRVAQFARRRDVAQLEKSCIYLLKALAAG